MKNAMKKLMSLLLVAVLVIGMIPFGASATGTYHTLTIQVNGTTVGQVSLAAGALVKGTDYVPGTVNTANLTGLKWTAASGYSNTQAPEAVNIPLNEPCTFDYQVLTCTGDVGCGANAHNAGCLGEPCTTAGCGKRIGATDHIAACAYWTCNENGCTSHSHADDASHNENCSKYRCANCNLPKASSNHYGACKHATVSDKCSTPLCNTSATAAKWTHITNCPEFRCRNCNLAATATGHTAPCEYAPAIEDPITPPAGGNQQGGNQQGGNQQGGNQQGGNNQDPQPVTNATLEVYVNGVNKVRSTVAAGKTVSALLAGSNLEFASAWTSHYTVTAVKVNSVSYNRVDIMVQGGDAVEVALARNYKKDNSHKVYLHVYLNGNAGTIAKTLDITSTYLMYDWATDVTEVKNYLSANFYNAANANGLQLDGLYITPGHFPTNYYSDNKQSAYTADQLRNDLESNHVNISVMLKNAVVKGSAAADKSNPKTGDSIYTAFTVMGVSAASLAAVMYFYNKKRYTV